MSISVQWVTKIHIQLILKLVFFANIPTAQINQLSITFQAGYEAGSGGKSLPPEFLSNLDNELIPIIHGQSSNQGAFEFVFHILDL